MQFSLSQFKVSILEEPFKSVIIYINGIKIIYKFFVIIIYLLICWKYIFNSTNIITIQYNLKEIFYEIEINTINKIVMSLLLFFQKNTEKVLYALRNKSNKIK